jgi:dihydropyrimidinase
MANRIDAGTVVNHDHSRHADVLTKDSAIVAIGANLEASAGAEVTHGDGR